MFAFIGLVTVIAVLTGGVYLRARLNAKKRD